MDIFNRKIEPVQLYPKQEKLIAAIRAAYKKGAKMPCVQASTGFGKSVVAGYIIKNALDKGSKRVVMIVDSLTLIDQLILTLEDKFGLDVGVIQGFNPRYDLSKKVQIATPQTLTRRFADDKWSHIYKGYDVSLVIIDECHVRHRGIDEAIGYWGCRGMGLTATPLAKGMANTYDALVKADSLSELMEDGDLAKYKVFSHPVSDFKNCKVSKNGDIQAEGVFTEDVIGDVFETWKSNSSQYLTIGYAPTIAKCEAFAQLFRDRGVNSMATHSKLTDDDSNNLIAKYKAGEIRVLWSVAKLIKGFDVPETKAMIDCQPTMSLMRHIQKVGRTLRRFDGIEFAIINDHAGNFVRNGFPEDIQITELSDGSEKENPDRNDNSEPSPIPCPQCKTMLKPVIPICPECGYERKAKSQESEPDDISTGKGELKELLKANQKRDRDTPINGKIEFIGSLRTYAKDKGKTEKWVNKVYKEYFGKMPDHPSIKSAPAGKTVLAANKYIKYLNIRGSRGKWGRR